jgi:hypothetical protein
MKTGYKAFPYLSQSTLEELRENPIFHDLTLKYKCNGVLVEKRVNKTLLAMHSKYFVSALTFASELQELDFSEGGFSGKAVVAVFNCLLGFLYFQCCF